MRKGIKKLSIIIPIYNEARTITQLLEKVKKASPSIDKEVIVVNDGSTDNTKDILSQIKDDDMKVISYSRNRGKGYAMRKGIKHVTGDIILTQDADLEYNPNDYQRLVTPIIEGRTNVVYGSRQLRRHKMAGIHYHLGGKLVTFITNLLYNSSLTDEPTGYKVFRASIIKNLNLKSNGFEFCPEVTAKLLKKGEGIIEVPISYRPRSKSEGKKIKWQDGLHAVVTLIKVKLNKF